MIAFKARLLASRSKAAAAAFAPAQSSLVLPSFQLDSKCVVTWRLHSTIPESMGSAQSANVKLQKLPSLPMFGSLIPQYSGIPDTLLTDGYSFWPEMRRRFGNFYKMGFPIVGRRDCLHGTLYIITDPREMESVIKAGGSHPSGLVESLWVSRKWNETRGMLIKGLFERGPEWKRVRQFMQTDLLHPESARGYVPGIIAAAQLASQGAPASRHDLDTYMGNCAFDMFSTIMFGELTNVADPTTPTNPENEFFATTAAMALGRSIGMLHDPKETILNAIGIDSAKCRKCFEDFDKCWEIGQRKIASFEKRKGAKELTENEHNSYLFRALDRQKEAGSELSVQEVHELIFNALFAAIDTTSSVIGWNLFHLARLPDVQEKLYSELKQAVDLVGKDGNLTVEALSRQQVPYLHAFIRETQRLTPPAPFKIVKEIDTNDITIFGTQLQKGEKVALEGFSIGMDPLFVEDPTEFRPERWLTKEVEARKGTPQEIIDHPFLKGPFSQGARRCPGSRVATNEIQVMLSQLVLDWKIGSPVASMDEASYHQGTMIEVELPELSFEARS